MNSQTKNLILPAAAITAIIIIGILSFWLYYKNPKLTSNAPENNSSSNSQALSIAGSATLSWNANTESDLAGYKIYYGASPRNSDCPPGGYTEKIDAGKTATPENPSYKIENLENGKVYYFSVTSYDVSNKESCFSSEVSKTMASK